MEKNLTVSLTGLEFGDEAPKGALPYVIFTAACEAEDPEVPFVFKFGLSPLRELPELGEDDEPMRPSEWPDLALDGPLKIFDGDPGECATVAVSVFSSDSGIKDASRVIDRLVSKTDALATQVRVTAGLGPLGSRLLEAIGIIGDGVLPHGDRLHSQCFVGFAPENRWNTDEPVKVEIVDRTMFTVQAEAFGLPVPEEEEQEEDPPAVSPVTAPIDSPAGEEE